VSLGVILVILIVSARACAPSSQKQALADEIAASSVEVSAIHELERRVFDGEIAGDVDWC
jgi:hypothetical protein